MASNWIKYTRDILFIERNLDFLKDQVDVWQLCYRKVDLTILLTNVSVDFIMERARLLAVIGLDVNTFKPHTGTKTSVLFIQKWDEDKKSPTYNPKIEDYPIFMGVSKKSGKDNSGEPIYKLNENGERKLDEHNHLILDHDLENIARAFELWAKEQKFSFWKF